MTVFNSKTPFQSFVERFKHQHDHVIKTRIANQSNSLSQQQQQQRKIFPFAPPPPPNKMPNKQHASPRLSTRMINIHQAKAIKQPQQIVLGIQPHTCSASNLRKSQHSSMKDFTTPGAPVKGKVGDVFGSKVMSIAPPDTGTNALCLPPIQASQAETVLIESPVQGKKNIRSKRDSYGYVH